MLKKLKTRTIWILTISLFILATILLILIPFSDGAMNTFLIVMVTIVFVLSTILVQYASFRSFKVKNKIKYNIKEYYSDVDLRSKLNKLGFTKRETKYGESYLLIKDKRAYKVVIVKDVETYFQPDEDDNTTVRNKELDKCKSFIAFEIFPPVEDNVKVKLYDFSIQGERVYYTALIKDGTKYTCLNHLEPNMTHNSSFNYLIDVLELKVIEEKA